MPLPESVEAIVFDAFGTLVNIGRPRRPYRVLADLADGGSSAFRHRVLTRDLSFDEVVNQTCPQLDEAMRGTLRAQLADEVASVRAFDDARHALERFRQAGMKVAVCSNLATPYAAPVLDQLPGPWDALAWSFAVGAAKPDPAIYRFVCDALALSPGRVMMVGDTRDADLEGPRHFGMQARWLQRAPDAERAADVVRSLGALADHVLGTQESPNKD
jgi:HAD superfamily hydrolase (TIGR01493 family)